MCPAIYAMNRRGNTEESSLRVHNCVELYGVKFHLPANQKLGCCCFRVNYAILPQHGCASVTPSCFFSDFKIPGRNHLKDSES